MGMCGVRQVWLSRNRMGAGVAGEAVATPAITYQYATVFYIEAYTFTLRHTHSRGHWHTHARSSHPPPSCHRRRCGCGSRCCCHCCRSSTPTASQTPSGTYARSWCLRCCSCCCRRTCGRLRRSEPLRPQRQRRHTAAAAAVAAAAAAAAAEGEPGLRGGRATVTLRPRWLHRCGCTRGLGKRHAVGGWGSAHMHALTRLYVHEAVLLRQRCTQELRWCDGCTIH